MLSNGILSECPAVPDLLSAPVKNGAILAGAGRGQ